MFLIGVIDTNHRYFHQLGLGRDVPLFGISTANRTSKDCILWLWSARTLSCSSNPFIIFRNKSLCVKGLLSNFLACYYKARNEALSAKVIKAGCKATGFMGKIDGKTLWSLLLLEDSNSKEKIAIFLIFNIKIVILFLLKFFLSDLYSFFF
jgi:hypothetical protein